MWQQLSSLFNEKTAAALPTTFSNFFSHFLTGLHITHNLKTLKWALNPPPLWYSDDDVFSSHQSSNAFLCKSQRPWSCSIWLILEWQMSFVVQRVVTKEHYSSIISTKESLFSKLEIHEVRRGNHITLHNTDFPKFSYRKLLCFY